MIMPPVHKIHVVILETATLSCFRNSSDGSTPPGLPGAVFLVRANAKTPLIYSVTLENEVGDGMVYDYFMTMEQLE
jgi:hypothetical protein